MGMAGVASPTVTQESVARALRGRKVDVKSWVFQAALLLTLIISLLVLIILLVNVFRVGWPVLADRGAEFITSDNSTIASRAGIWQGLWGSLLLMGIVVVVAFPLGIGAAVYMEEYARDNRLTRFINANIRNLAGVPAIVYGILGLVIFVKALSSFTGGKSVLAGGLTLAVLVLPIVIITTAEALRAVPWSIREAGFGVGATQWEVIRSHVLPSATPGILTGTVLSLARAFGETAPLILVGAVTGFFASGSGSFWDKLTGPYTALPTLIFDWSRQPQEAVRANAAAAIIVLMVLILLVNATAIILRNRYARKW
jgi:phosphate transport system permease protein